MAKRLQCRAERTSKPNYLVIILACVHLSTCSRRLPSRPSRQPQLANNYTTIAQVFHLIIHILGHTHTHTMQCAFLKPAFLFHSHTHYITTATTPPFVANTRTYATRFTHPVSRAQPLSPPSARLPHHPNDVLNIKLYARRDRLPCTHTNTHVHRSARLAAT